MSDDDCQILDSPPNPPNLEDGEIADSPEIVLSGTPERVTEEMECDDEVQLVEDCDFVLDDAGAGTFCDDDIKSMNTPVSVNFSTKKQNSRGNGCFNCGGNHTLNDCPEDKDFARIQKNRRSHMENNKMKETRIYQGQLTKFTAGKLSEAARNALGINNDEYPPWIYKMREEGLFAGYPPGYLEKLMPRTDTLEFFTDDPTFTGEKKDVENNFKIDAEQVIFYEGFNDVDPYCKAEKALRRNTKEYPKYSKEEYTRKLEDYVKRQYERRMNEEKSEKRKKRKSNNDDYHEFKKGDKRGRNSKKLIKATKETLDAFYGGRIDGMEIIKKHKDGEILLDEEELNYIIDCSEESRIMNELQRIEEQSSYGLMKKNKKNKKKQKLFKDVKIQTDSVVILDGDIWLELQESLKQNNDNRGISLLKRYEKVMTMSGVVSSNFNKKLTKEKQQKNDDVEIDFSNVSSPKQNLKKGKESGNIKDGKNADDSQKKMNESSHVKNTGDNRNKIEPGDVRNVKNTGDNRDKIEPGDVKNTRTNNSGQKKTKEIDNVEITTNSSKTTRKFDDKDTKISGNVSKKRNESGNSKNARNSNEYQKKTKETGDVKSKNSPQMHKKEAIKAKRAEKQKFSTKNKNENCGTLTGTQNQGSNEIEEKQNLKEQYKDCKERESCEKDMDDCDLRKLEKKLKKKLSIGRKELKDSDEILETVKLEGNTILQSKHEGFEINDFLKTSIDSKNKNNTTQESDKCVLQMICRKEADESELQNLNDGRMSGLSTHSDPAIVSVIKNESKFSLGKKRASDSVLDLMERNTIKNEIKSISHEILTNDNESVLGTGSDERYPKKIRNIFTHTVSSILKPIKSLKKKKNKDDRGDSVSSAENMTVEDARRLRNLMKEPTDVDLEETWENRKNEKSSKRLVESHMAVADPVEARRDPNSTPVARPIGERNTELNDSFDVQMEESPASPTLPPVVSKFLTDDQAKPKPLVFPLIDNTALPTADKWAEGITEFKYDNVIEGGRGIHRSIHEVLKNYNNSSK